MPNLRFSTFREASDHVKSLDAHTRSKAKITRDGIEFIVVYPAASTTANPTQFKSPLQTSSKPNSTSDFASKKQHFSEPEIKAPVPYLTSRPSLWLAQEIAPTLPTDSKPRDLPPRLVSADKELPLPAIAAAVRRDHSDETASRTLCMRCGLAISLERLKANPGAQRCIKCQSELELTRDTRKKAMPSFAGTDEQIRAMKARQWGEMASRGKIPQKRKK